MKESNDQSMFSATAVTLRLQIIVGSLVMGAGTFGVVTFFMEMDAAQNNVPVVSYTFYAFTVCIVAARLFVPNLIVRQSRRRIANGTWTANPGMNPNATAVPKTDAEKVAAVYQTRTIIAAALLEGAAFFGWMAFLMERQVAAAVIAGGLTLLIALHVPLRFQVAAWIDSELQHIEILRQMPDD